MASPRKKRRAPSGPKRKPTLDFSVTGLIYTAMMLFMGLAAINSQANLLFAVFGLMIGVLLISGAISRLVLRKLEVRRVLPEHLVVGDPATLQYDFENQKRFWPTLSVTIGELSVAPAFTRQPQAYLLHLAAGTKAIVPMQVVPRRRGIHHFDRYQLSTSFPFCFIKRATDRRMPDSILIHPPLAQLDPALVNMCLSAEQSGTSMRPRRGGNDEFYGIKEYRTGESPRMIYWKRSARTGQLVSKEMTLVSPPRLLVMVDTHVPADDRTLERHGSVEKAIAMAASLITNTIEQGLAIGLYVWADGWTMVPPSRGKRHARDLLSLLSRLPLNTEFDRKALVESTHKLIKPGTTPILLTPTGAERTLGDISRGNWITIPVHSELANRWFKFPDHIDFTQCMPPDQVPPVAVKPAP